MDQKAVDQVDKLKIKVDILTRLTEISTVLNSTLQLEPLLAYLMDAAAEMTASEDASVLLWNNKTHELFFAASTSGSAVENLMGKPVPLDSIAGTIFKEKRNIQVDDTQSDPRHYNKVDEESQFVTRSLLGVPMTFKNRVIGVLEVVNKRQLPWTKDDHRYLSILAAQAAVAIEVAQLVNDLRKANDELSQLDKLKNDFIAIASHELRTPLGVILGYASFLQEEEDSEVSDHASKVMASALQLRRIIEGMVNLRYVKQSQAVLQLENVPVADLLQTVQHDILALATGNNINVQILPPTEDIVVQADTARISMALTNILSNAVSFTPPGGKIIIAVRARNSKEAEISVIDNGLGIEADQQEKIFEEFYQVEDHMTRHHGGLGIGLSITKAIVEAHRGRIWCESAGLNEGATFTFTLPLA